MKKIYFNSIAIFLVLISFLSVGVTAFATEQDFNGTNNLRIINAKSGLFLTWDAVEEATEYRLKKYDPTTDTWSLITGITKTFYQDYDVENGVTYTYKLCFANSEGVEKYFKDGEKFRCLHAPRITLSCTPNSVMIVWNTYSSASQYRIYRKLPGDVQWTCIRVVRDNKVNYIMDYNVINGQNYVYTIKQMDGNVPGSYNIEGFSTRFCKAPTITSKHSPKGVVINWTKYNSGKYTYIIDHRSAVSPSWKTVGEVYDKGTYTCSFDNIDFGVINYFRVRLKNTNVVTYSTSVYGIDPNKPMVALTYDDGPLTSVTNSIVSTLKKNGARATFFVVGNRVNTYKNSLKNAVNAGCEIGNHTYDHYILTNYKQSTIKNQINKTNNAVKNITGKSPTLVRAPGGSFNSTVKSSVKYPLIQWNVDTLDWKNRNANSVVSAVKGNVKDGSIILMHDLYKSTADATKTIVPWLKSQGYQMVTVTELMQIRGYDLNAGQVYYSGYKK